MPGPGAVVMQYTGHSDLSGAEPATAEPHPGEAARANRRGKAAHERGEGELEHLNFMPHAFD